MSLSLVRPIAASCSSVDRASQARQVVNVLLDDHVAAAREVRLLVADQNRFRGGHPLGVLGSVDEPEHVAVVE